MKESSDPRKYLGLPMKIGSKKNAVFSFLTDRVRQKLQGWENVMLSKAGKCILLKTTTQSIPKFWMNLMLIPNEVCNTIQRQMNSFWWGNGKNKKGVRWMVWDRMCHVKEAGGLGFKDLKQFNIAMLAKQGWRLLNDANPFVTKLMKSKYFPNTDFLNAQLGASPSYMWRSIFAAQSIVKQGCRRSIGTGEDTSIWNEPWLTCPENGYITTTVSPELQLAKVSSLLEVGDRRWDGDILRDLFNDRDVQWIKRIPLPIISKRDS